MTIVFPAIIVVLLVLVSVGYALFYIGICRFPKDPPVKASKKMERYAQLISDGGEWFRSRSPENVSVSASDGTRLAGLYLEHPHAKGTIIMVHGFRSDPFYDFSRAFECYYSQGYSLLAVYQRAHGLSGGEYISFGIKERFDCRDWAKYIYDRFGPEHDIFLSGLSMGASTVLMACGTGLPSTVRGIVAYCGFTSPYAEFREILKHKFHLPEHPFLDIAQTFCRIMAGFSFKEYSTVDAMKENSIPILFIHGEADSLVPSKFTRENYDACAGEKVLVLVPGADDWCGCLVDTERCRKELTEFLTKHASTSDSRGQSAPDISELPLSE